MTNENVYVQMQSTDRVATAVLPASLITAVMRLPALLCMHFMFILAFIRHDPLRSLFMPPSLGVGFAMIPSYLLSSTFALRPVVVPSYVADAMRPRDRLPGECASATLWFPRIDSGNSYSGSGPARFEL